MMDWPTFVDTPPYELPITDASVRWEIVENWPARGEGRVTPVAPATV